MDVGKFTIENVSPEDLEIKVVSQPHGYFKLGIPKKVKAGRTIKCKLKVNKDKLKEEFQKSITIELNDAAKTRFTIPVIRRFIDAPRSQSTSK